MADIFISYKKEDAGRVVRIVEGLRKEGFSVWWDHGIAPGAQWDQTIQRELNASKVVIAVWSEMSVSAPWVREEAAVGKKRGALVPVRIDDVDPPLGFSLIQMATLIGWDGDIEDATWDHFIAAVKATLDGKPMPGLEKPVKRKSKAPMIAGVLAVLAAAVLGGGWWAVTQLGGVSGLTVDYDDGTTSTYSRTGAGGPAAAGEAEQAMFDKAQGSRLRADYLDYLRAYSDGAYADQIRNDILPFCSTEQREVFTPQSVSQALVGVSAESMVGGEMQLFDTEAAACEAARGNVSQRAEQMCRLISTNSQGRNGVASFEWNDCSCEYVVNTWSCSVEPTYACSWEMPGVEVVEVCN